MSGEPSSEDFFVHGFARACFDAGLHEKQASALLTAYMESTSNGMEKEAFWRGIGMALKGLGTAGVGALAGIGRGAGQIASLPFKHPKAALKGLGALGGLGAAGAGIYGLNRLANSDTAVGRFAGDMLGSDFKNMSFGDSFNPEDVHKFRDAVSRPDPITKIRPDNPFIEPGSGLMSGDRLRKAKQYELERKDNQGLATQQSNLTRNVRRYEDQLNDAYNYSQRARQAKEDWQKAHWYNVGAWARNKAYEMRGGGIGSEQYENAKRKLNALNEAQNAMNKKTGIGNANLGANRWQTISEDGLK